MAFEIRFGRNQNPPVQFWAWFQVCDPVRYTIEPVASSKYRGFRELTRKGPLVAAFTNDAADTTASTQRNLHIVPPRALMGPGLGAKTL